MVTTHLSRQGTIINDVKIYENIFHMNYAILSFGKMPFFGPFSQECNVYVTKWENFVFHFATAETESGKKTLCKARTMNPCTL